MKNSDKIGADLSGAKHGCAQPSSMDSDAAGNFRGLSSLLVSNQIDLIGSWCRRAQLNNGSPLRLCKELVQRARSRFASLYLRYMDGSWTERRSTSRTEVLVILLPLCQRRSGIHVLPHQHPVPPVEPLHRASGRRAKQSQPQSEAAPSES